MKEYRSAIRSRNLIKKAFIDLVAKKEVSKITVVDIVNEADISRNTFYAHYCDVFAVLEDIENGAIAKLNAYLDEAIAKRQFYNPLPLLQKFQKFIENNMDYFRVLLLNKNAFGFCEKIKDIVIKRVLDNLGDVSVKDTDGFLVLLECIASGYIDLMRMSLKGEADYTLDDITRRINDVFVHGVKLYC